MTTSNSKSSSTRQAQPAKQRSSNLSPKSQPEWFLSGTQLLSYSLNYGVASASSVSSLIVEGKVMPVEATTPITPKKAKELTFEIAKDKTVRGFTKNEDDPGVKTQDFLAAMARRAPSDSGLLPPGLLSVRTGGKYTQVVVQTEPDVHTVCWGETEGSSHSVYPLAMPWRVIIAVFTEDQLYGARVFYSPRQVTSLRQPLYHANVPNLNCMGYNNTAVGWLCLYQVGSKFVTLREKTLYAIDRASGGEPFNNANMNGTDGPRFYHAALKALGKDPKEYAFLWDPDAWAKKSEAEGAEWTLDEDLWIPVLVEGIDSQSTHKADGIPLTLGGAMYGDYRTYYHDAGDDKPYNGYARARGYSEGRSRALFDSMSEAYTALANDTWRAPAVEDAELLLETFEHPIRGLTIKIEARPYCGDCGEIVNTEEAVSYNDTWWCEECVAENVPHCAICEEMTTSPLRATTAMVESHNAKKGVGEISRYSNLCMECFTPLDKRVKLEAKKMLKAAAVAVSTS